MMLDVSSLLAVIVGGGAVACRKARGLLQAGATRIRCISPDFEPDFPGAVERITGPYEARHLDGAALVFAATNSAEVNETVTRDAHARGILVCRADSDDDTPGDFATPALLTRGDVRIAVSTSGSAALAVAIRDGLAQRFDLRWQAMADAMLQLRPLIRGCKILDAAQRSAIFRDLAGEAALGVVAQGGSEALRRWLLARYPELEHA